MLQKNDYGIGDVNFTTMMDTLDKTRIGFHAVSLTEMDSAVFPAVEAGSCIEINGALFHADVEDAIGGAPSDGNVYIKYVPDADEADPEFTNTPPVWDSEKQGWYSPTVGEENHRYLEFYIIKSGDSYLKYKITEDRDVWITANGTWTAPWSRWYTFYLTGAGEAGGAGGRGGNVASISSGGPHSAPTQGTYGGRAGSTGIKKIYVLAGTVWTAVVGSSHTTFTDGVTSLSANAAGGAVTGCDVSLIGKGGSYGGAGGQKIRFSIVDVDVALIAGGNGISGGASVYGSGGYGGVCGITTAGSAGEAGSVYGSGGGGGGGGGGELYLGGAGGAGANGVIRIL